MLSNITVDIAFYDRGMPGKAFTYALPQDINHETITVGMQVIAPIGNISQRGIILSIQKCDNVHDLQVITSILPHSFGTLLTPWQGSLVKWLSWYYLCPMQHALRLMVAEQVWNDGYQPKRSNFLVPKGSMDSIPSRAVKQRELHHLLTAKGRLSIEETKRHFSSSTIKAALEKSYAAELPGPLLSPIQYTEQRADFILSEEQKVVFDHILSSTDTPYLLHGETGAGKTEIYVHIAREMLRQGKQTLIMVPEIALTTHLITYINERFPGQVALLHSKVSKGNRMQEWCRIKSGDAKVIVGSRLSLFSPFSNLGSILIDEEHEWSYKSDKSPRYDARSAALYIHSLLRQAGTPIHLVYASATPSLERYALCKKDGDHRMVYLHLQKKFYEQTSTT